MARVGNFHNTIGVGGLKLPRKARCSCDGFQQTSVTLSRQLCKSGRGISQVSSSRARAQERSESSPFSTPEARKELLDINFKNVEEIDQPVKSSPASHVSPTKEDGPDGKLPKLLKTALRYYFNEVRAGCSRILNDPNPVQALGNILRDEGNVIYLMMCNDFSSTILAYWCIGANLVAASPFLQTGEYQQLWLQAATTVTKEVCYGFLYLYSFNLANQYNGAAGDAIDKQWRPLPSGLLTEDGALARCFLVNLLFDFVSWHLGILHWTLIWQAIIASQFLGYEKDNSSRGLGRSVAMFIGTVVLCSAGASLATTMTPTLQLWTVTRGALSGNHHWMQDFRDLEGDKRVGRTTFPLLFGVEKARKLMAFVFLMDPIFVHFVVMKDSSYSTPQLILEGLGAVICVILAYRVMNFKTPAEDNETYTLWLTTFWHNWNFLLVGPAFLVGLDSH